MPRIPEENPLKRRDLPLSPVHTIAEEEERSGHGPRILYLGALASDPASEDLPDDNVIRIFNVDDALKCAIAGTVYILAPLAVPLSDAGPSGNQTLTASFVEVSGLTLDLTAGDWIVLLVADLYMTSAGAGEMRAQMLIDGGDPDSGSTWVRAPEPAATNQHFRAAVVALHNVASGTETVTVRVAKGIDAGAASIDKDNSTLVAFVPGGATQAGGGGGGGVTDHGALTGLTDDDHTQYQKESEKSAANGYASLDGSTTIPDAEIPATIARDSELHAETHTLASHTTKAVAELSDVADSGRALNDVLKWDGANWVPGTAGDTGEFTFTLDSFSGSGVGGTQLIGLGDWKAIAAITFNAGYTNPPGGLTAVVALSGAANPWAGNLDMTGTPPDGPTTNTEAVEWPSSRTGTLTFTLTPSDSPTPATRQDSIAFKNTMRYGNSAETQGNQTEATLEALTEVSGPNESRSQTISNIPTTANQLVFGYADALSKPSQVQMNSGDGYVTAAFGAAATTLAPLEQAGVANVGNSKSFSETFACVTSLITGLANNTNDFKLLTNATAQNYLHWGEVAVDAGGDGGNVYSEGNVEDTSRGDTTASNSISSRNMTVTGGDGSKYAFIAYPARLGLLSSIVIGGFESIGDFWIDAGSGTELPVTNDAGYTEDYYVYVAKNPGFGSGTTMVVSL